VAEGARGVEGWGHGTILPRLSSIEDNGVVSHPFRKERGMDGAPSAMDDNFLLPSTRRADRQFYESKRPARESCILHQRVHALVVVL
jgi:hypothetical protein